MSETTNTINEELDREIAAMRIGEEYIPMTKGAPGRIGPWTTTKRSYNVDSIISDADVKLLDAFPGVQYTYHHRYYLHIEGTQYIDWTAFEEYMSGVLNVAVETTVMTATSDCDGP